MYADLFVGVHVDAVRALAVRDFCSDRNRVSAACLWRPCPVEFSFLVEEECVVVCCVELLCFSVNYGA